MVDTLYERVTVGRYADGSNVIINRRTQAMIWMVNRRLPFDLTLVQGSYHTTTTASAGTHDGGGVVDFRTWDLSETQRGQALAVARQEGFYAWYRTAAQGFDPHMHWVAKADAELSPSAKQQAIDAEAGYNGLASHLKDNLNLDVPTFNYEEYLVALLEDRVSVLEARVTATTDARAQYAYGSVTGSGAVATRLATLEGRVGPDTKSHADYAYNAVTGDDSLYTRISAVAFRIATVEASLETLEANDKILAIQLAELQTAVKELQAPKV